MELFLILRLDGPLQAWGTHTFEDYRPANLFPTRSGLLGLIGACLGIDRDDRETFDGLAQSVRFAVRTDKVAQIEAVSILPHQPIFFRRGNRAGKLIVVTFEGVLRVQDPKALRGQLENGIGPAKAFGCGLMLVRRLDAF